MTHPSFVWQVSPRSPHEPPPLVAETFCRPLPYLRLNSPKRVHMTRNPGRFAGLLNVLMSIPGFFALIYVPSKLIVHGNATATATNIGRVNLEQTGRFPSVGA